MRPTEVEKLHTFRNTIISLYSKFGQEAKDKIWINHEVKVDVKSLIEFFDNLFKDELLSK